MGICASSPMATSKEGKAGAGGRRAERRGPTAWVVHMGDGWAREYTAGAVTAEHVEAENAGCYLCSSEAMNVGQRPPREAEFEELQAGQLYFLLPLASLGKPLTLRDLCELAVTAGQALG